MSQYHRDEEPRCRLLILGHVTTKRGCPPAACWLLRVLLCSALALPFIQGQSQPTVTLDTPASGANEISGHAYNVDTSQVKVVIYALTNEWYVQPYVDAPFTNISPDGSWSSFVNPWSSLVVLLVNPANYTPAATEITNPALDAGVLASTEYPSTPISVNFSGYTWGIKTTGNAPSDQFDPGPNFWSSDPSVVSVASDGLHLKITEINNVWQCGEVYLLRSLGYGTYTVHISSNLSQLDRNTVAAPLFIYAAPGQELDNEYSGTGGLVASPYNAQVVVQPYTVPGNIMYYSQPSTSQFTSQMEWAADHVTFRTWNGWSSTPAPTDIIYQWTYSGAYIPPVGQERVHLNLWLLNGNAPVSRTGGELIINSFNFQPAAGAVVLNRTKLNYGYSGTLISSPQTVAVTITGGLNVNWTVSSTQPNIIVAPSSGVGSGELTVTANPGPSGTVTITAPGLISSPQQITINITNVAPTQPFGYFDAPANNTTGISGAVPVTGWALDDIQVANVGIWRAPVPGETPSSNGLVFIGNANFVADARPDVAATYPNAPYQYRGGWGYQMLTNFLPNSTGSGVAGNGTYNLHAIATNAGGATFDLGIRTITVDNTHATQPFGTIDTPDQGGTANGNAFVNFGWALTQNPFAIPTNGSSISVILDSVAVGSPIYNNYRSDIANLFPGLANSNGAVGYFYFDTTTLSNKVHTISWNVYDNGGRGAGLGSRYFTVFNPSGGVAAPQDVPTADSLAGPVRLRSGYDLNAPQVAIAPNAAGIYSIEMEQVGRIELSLGATKGHQVVAGQPADLPLGASLKAGVLYWQPPPGFLGRYELIFERANGSVIAVDINVLPALYSIQ
jgi:hypothetical protein